MTRNGCKMANTKLCVIWMHSDYNMLARWVDGTNNSSNKRLMFQALFFFIFFYRLRSSTCPLTGSFWLLSHVIYLKLTKVLYECLLSQAEWWIAELLFLSLNNWGLNFLQNECSQSSQIYLSPEKVRKMFIFQKVQASGVERQKKKFCYPSLSLGKKTLRLI